ncbi:hypothetical protein [Sphingobium cupriresistens]|uniref:Uncharacterized protein n=1 Tax=Sphingobium cupriresistens LL01 TaxID=1420583 RepID=A0A0J7Y529_9SPHN|nr:hypothetical protein [Sphingobium cupriresistens]KMS58772.1 hypothetical protein V473_07110 [Sphingobium cupriresistens LL01]
MSNVVRLHTPGDVHRLWDEYAALVRAVREDPALMDNRPHNEAMIRAHRRFASAFAASENIA